MGLWATGMDKYDQMLLLVNRWVTQIDLVASGGHFIGGVLVPFFFKISKSKTLKFSKISIMYYL